MYVYDAHRNPVGLITDSGAVAYHYAFDPYGTAVLTQNSGGNGVPQNPYFYAGGLQDRDTGLIRYGARWYNPTTGTWTQRDTLDAPLDAANANRYAYAGDDPINAADPTGLFCQGILECGTAGGIAGSFAGVGAGAIIGGLTSFGVGAIPGAIAGGQAGGEAGVLIGGTVGAVQDLYNFFSG